VIIQDKLEQAAIHHQAGDYAQAEILYRECLSTTRDQAGILYRLGEVCYLQNKFDAAIHALHHASLLEPCNPEYRFSLSSILQLTGSHAEAAIQLREAINIKPDYAEAHLNLGINHYEQDQYGEAIRCYLRAVELEPNDARAHYNLALAYTRSDSHARLLYFNGHVGA